MLMFCPLCKALIIFFPDYFFKLAWTWTRRPSKAHVYTKRHWRGRLTYANYSLRWVRRCQSQIVDQIADQFVDQLEDKILMSLSWFERHYGNSWLSCVSLLHVNFCFLGRDGGIMLHHHQCRQSKTQCTHHQPYIPQHHPPTTLSF